MSWMEARVHASPSDTLAGILRAISGAPHWEVVSLGDNNHVVAKRRTPGYPAILPTNSDIKVTQTGNHDSQILIITTAQRFIMGDIFQIYKWQMKGLMFRITQELGGEVDAN